MTNTVLVTGNKTLGEGDDGTVQCIEAAAVITLPHEDTWKFLKEDEFTIVSNTSSDVSVVGENDVTLMPNGKTLSAKGESATIKYQGSNTYLVWAVIWVVLVVGTLAYSTKLPSENTVTLINWIK